jgi:hypothetical protein
MGSAQVKRAFARLACFDDALHIAKIHRLAGKSLETDRYARPTGGESLSR